MLSQKIDAIEMHKFLKENISKNIISVDLRQPKSKPENIMYGKIEVITKNGIEINYIMFNDEKFCITTSVDFNLLNTPKEINSIWENYLNNKFNRKTTKNIQIIGSGKRNFDSIKIITEMFNGMNK